MKEIQPSYKVENLELFAKQAVEGFIIGLHKSPYHGFSVEFAEHKAYYPGQPVKNIDWKVLGRTDKLFVKKYEEETNLRCQIILDTSSSMRFPKGELDTKLSFSVQAAASLTKLLVKQRDAVGLTLFNQEITFQCASRLSKTNQKLMFSELVNVLTDKEEIKTTAIAPVLHQIAEQIHKRSLVIIFSDMFDSQENMENLLSALNHLKYKKHEVILFHVTDPDKEQVLNYENKPTRFVDLETGDEVKLHPNQVQEFYTEKMKNYYSRLKLKCGQYKVDFVEANIQQGVEPILMSFLHKRSKMV